MMSGLTVMQTIEIKLGTKLETSRQEQVHQPLPQLQDNKQARQIIKLLD